MRNRHGGIFGMRRGGRRSGAGLVVITGAWASLAWAMVACGDQGEEARLAAATTTAVTTPAPSTEPAPTPAATVEPAVTPEPEPSVPSTVSYGDAETVYRAGKYHDAMELFSVYVLRRPENPWGHYMMGLASWKAGELERAESALTKSVELSPQHVKGLVNLGRVQLERDRPEDAMKHLEVAADLAPESADVWRVMGNALSDLGRNDEAVEAYRHALAFDDDDPWSMNNLALVLIRQGRYEEALPPLARATELSPKTAVFQNNLGVALERSGYVTESRVAYQAALDANPTYAKAGISLERVEQLKTDPDTAPLDLTALARAFADDVSRWKDLASREEEADVVPLPEDKPLPEENPVM